MPSGVSNAKKGMTNILRPILFLAGPARLALNGLLLLRGGYLKARLVGW